MLQRFEESHEAQLEVLEEHNFLLSKFQKSAFYVPVYYYLLNLGGIAPLFKSPCVVV